MKKLYTVKQFTAAQYDALPEYPAEENEILIIRKPGALCMDITAEGVRVVPILRKIEATLTAAGLAGESGPFAGWFGEWANSLTSRQDRKYFIWNYSGLEDIRNGVWSYSWGIEQQDDSLWYIFLNIAVNDEEPKEVEPVSVFNTIRQEVEARTTRGAWSHGVEAYALELVDELEEAAEGGYFDLSDLVAPKLVHRAMLNGAQDWKQYSWGGSSLIYDRDIARRLCNSTELRQTRDGERQPNAREQWLDTQARALFQASERVQEAIRAAVGA